MANAKPQYSKLLPRHGIVYIDSDIIESEHSVIISSWIEKKFEKLSCKFILAYRGTRDGFDSNISYYIHGYYGSDCFEDACFEEEHWTSANDSHVENPEKAIYNNSCADESWLNFGGGDLVLKDQRGTCSKCNYEKTILEDYIFIAEEVEIFQVQMPKG
ncbi:13842_t:CDS:2 [Gigaspora margarita]|uniref:13842_t:CDS:1 n=1 Tax=Gigaspora margarita TaxID=4874 RepID=A0ABN7VAT3_GIGMA|nr:13842_t:CDS:2 [Gigaspora margarita]